MKSRAHGSARTLTAWVTDTRFAQLEAALDAALGVAALQVKVTRGCGAVEIRVAGPGATLMLAFDPDELRPAEVGCAVGAAIARYGSSLLAGQGPGLPGCAGAARSKWPPPLQGQRERDLEQAP